MSRHLFVVILLLGLLAPISASAQVPPAGTAGAGATAINGIPFGPANPSVLSDPSGTLNASRVPSPAINPVAVTPPPPQPVYGPIASPERASTPYASQRVFSANETGSRRPPVRRHGRAQISSFTGICRGC